MIEIKFEEWSEEGMLVSVRMDRTDLNRKRENIWAKHEIIRF